MSQGDVEALNTPGGEGTSRINSQPQLSNDGSQAKRRRTDLIPEWESARPQWEQELGESQARQHINEIVQRPWTTVNSPATMPTPQTMNDMNGSVTVPPRPVEQRNSMGWATVNQPAPVPASQTYDRSDSNGGGFRSMEQTKREETVINEEGSTALIDTLPKSKQRQVYG